jgi:hypothetical protein
MALLSTIDLARPCWVPGETIVGYVTLHAEAAATLYSVLLRVFACERTFLERVVVAPSSLDAITSLLHCMSEHYHTLLNHVLEP